MKKEELKKELEKLEESFKYENNLMIPNNQSKISELIKKIQKIKEKLEER